MYWISCVNTCFPPKSLKIMTCFLTLLENSLNVLWIQCVQFCVASIYREDLSAKQNKQKKRNKVRYHFYLFLIFIMYLFLFVFYLVLFCFDLNMLKVNLFGFLFFIMKFFVWASIQRLHAHDLGSCWIFLVWLVLGVLHNNDPSLLAVEQQLVQK